MSSVEIDASAGSSITIPIENHGAAPLFVQAVVLSGEGFVLETTLPSGVVVRPGARLALHVRADGAAANVEGVLEIRTNDPAQPIAHVRLTVRH
jgi:hypothetical protein